ncbi:MAG: hypothetical protein ABI191_01825 [Rhizomicrobium sp.]
MKPRYLPGVMFVVTLLACGPVSAAPADGAAFARFDTTGNGYLSGTEIQACGCAAADANGDGRVTQAEYLAGKLEAAAGRAQPKRNAYVPIVLPLPAQPPKAPEAATGKSLPAGMYACQIWSGSMLMTLGKVEIKGATYRGPSNTPTGPFKPLVIDAAGMMSWSPNFSQLASTGAVITRSRISGTPAQPAFTVEYTTGRGYRESMDCTKE